MIGFVELEYRIFDCMSLKEKRSILKRTMTRVKQKYNVATAETGHQDVWQLTKISLVTVASSRQATERELNHALNFLDSFPEWERLNTTFEWL